ncbi:hypothetical protein ACWD3J_41730 [Streptomyces sp. NPDC002755]
MTDNRLLVAVREHPRDEGAGAGQLVRIREAIEARGFDVRWAVDAADAEAVLRTEAGTDRRAGRLGAAGPRGRRE